MKFLISYATSVGIKKDVNQDALCIKKAVVDQDEFVLAVICDGMGGLSSGELASATVIRRFSEWFDKELPSKAATITPDEIKTKWATMIFQLNEKLWNYGSEIRRQLGTTLTAVLIFPNGTYVTAHVGDTRQYRINQNVIEQITEDQTFIAREIKRGNMTKEEAMKDSRRNVLLQCIGASSDVEPAFWQGQVQPKDSFLLCSDGFRHVLTEDEIYETIMGENLYTEQAIANTLGTMIGINESRGETDNITAILIKNL